MRTAGRRRRHADLDAVFLNITVISKVNTKFLEELEAEHKNWPDVAYGPIICEVAKKFKGCYTRYVNNYDAAEQHLNKLKASDKEKHRYLEVCKTHPDAHGLDLRSFLIQPVQRVPRYRMLLEDLLNHTEEGHPDEEPLRDALEKVKEVAAHINEDKRKAEDVEKLNAMVARFTSDSGMDRELVRYDRRFLREGDLTKARLQRRQKRHCFLFNDLLLYTVSTAKGFQVKGKISLGVDARVEMLPDTETMTNAFAVIEKGGKGYTWLTDSAEETKEWFEAVNSAIRSNRTQRATASGVNLLQGVQSKPPEARLAVLRSGTLLMKYNQRDGKSGPRWVKLDASDKVCWGDARTKETKSSIKLDDAIALMHGAKSSAFFKQQGAKKDQARAAPRTISCVAPEGARLLSICCPLCSCCRRPRQDWLCFSIVFKGRGTLDFAATNADALLDWRAAFSPLPTLRAPLLPPQVRAPATAAHRYLALASKIKHSTEPLLDEAALRARIESMF